MCNKYQSSLFKKRHQTWAECRSPICSGRHSDICHHLSFIWDASLYTGFSEVLIYLNFKALGFEPTQDVCARISVSLFWYCEQVPEHVYPPRDTIILPRTTYCGCIFFFFYYNVNFLLHFEPISSRPVPGGDGKQFIGSLWAMCERFSRNVAWPIFVIWTICFELFVQVWCLCLFNSQVLLCSLLKWRHMLAIHGSRGKKIVLATEGWTEAHQTLCSKLLAYWGLHRRNHHRGGRTLRSSLIQAFPAWASVETKISHSYGL